MLLSGLEDDEQVRAVETAAMAAKRISQFLTRDTERDTLTLKPDTNDERPQSQVRVHLYDSESEKCRCLEWIHGFPSCVFTLTSDKDQRKFSLSLSPEQIGPQMRHQANKQITIHGGNGIRSQGNF